MHKKIVAPEVIIIQEGSNIFIGFESKLSLFSASNHKTLWTKRLFEQNIQNHIEKDVQLDFIKSMEIVGDKIVITTRKGKEFFHEL